MPVKLFETELTNKNFFAIGMKIEFMKYDHLKILDFFIEICVYLSKIKLFEVNICIATFPFLVRTTSAK